MRKLSLVLCLACCPLTAACRSIELAETTHQIAEAGQGTFDSQSPVLVLQGFERTRQETNYQPGIGFALAASTGSGVSVGPTFGISRRTREVPSDDVRPLLKRSLNGLGLTARVGQRPPGALTLTGQIQIGLENRLVNGLYQGLITLVPVVLLGVPIHEDGILVTTTRLYDPSGMLIDSRVTVTRWSLWTDFYGRDDAVEQARLAAIKANVTSLARELSLTFSKTQPR